MVDPAPGYRAPDTERRVAEPPKDPRRGDFARDRARVLHSAALRRLAAKTQVVRPQRDDFVRNRLTHSLEVAQVGRELGVALGCDPDVVETACLAHDLGHPPFGHNGEAVLDQVAAAAGGFEGNAQTLRLLTRLEPKVVDADGRPAGLNLTRATLDACTKYPWPRGGGPGGPGARKFGAYRDDEEAFGWLRQGAPAVRRCVEAQVMDLADDVAYSVHDVEDAVVGGSVEPGWLAEAEPVARLEKQVREWYLPDLAEGEVAEAVLRVRAMPAWLERYDGGYRSLAALKDLTSQLIGRFTGAVTAATRAAHGPGPLTRFSADVVVPRGTLVEIAALKGVAALWVMSAENQRITYRRQQDLLSELAGTLVGRGPDGLDRVHAAAWHDAADDAARLRVVVDQIASLTDASAVALHDALCRGRRPRDV